MHLYADTVSNWTDANTIQIDAKDYGEEIGQLVTLKQEGGAMHFQFSLRADAARDMARKLIAAADQLDFEAMSKKIRDEHLAGLEETEAARAQ